MKKADYTRKTQALQSERQTLERYTTELRSKVEQIEQDLSARANRPRRSWRTVPPSGITTLSRSSGLPMPSASM